MQPEVAVITPIDFDHENFLGHSIEEIAGEKAGIIKPGAWVVSAAERPEARAVIARRCKEVDARLVEVDAAWRIDEERDPADAIARLLRRGFATRTIAIEPSLPDDSRFATRSRPRRPRACSASADSPSTTKRSRAAFATLAGPAGSSGSPSARDCTSTARIILPGARELLKFWEENFAGRRILLVYGAMRDKAVDEIAGLLFPRPTP